MEYGPTRVHVAPYVGPEVKKLREKSQQKTTQCDLFFSGVMSGGLRDLGLAIAKKRQGRW